MSYASISVREAMDRINAPYNGWFLPQVQRQYVWGNRHESEDYICLLLDSLLQRYPIGGIVLWETDSSVPYREFVGDYLPGAYAHMVDKGRWDAHKSLVYDGQQRLQTLYSVLRHRFNGRILHFDLLFDRNAAESDETGFLFRDASAASEPRYLNMTRLASRMCTPAEKVRLEMEAATAADNNISTQLRVRENLGALWDVFVDTTIKSMAYFAVRAQTAKEVNEVFRRLNTGGVSLTQIELVLGRIKATHYDYEERLWGLSERIAKASGGIEFDSAEIIQFLHLMVKKTIRIDEDRLATADISHFHAALTQHANALVEVFSEYLWGRFRINNASVIPRMLAILPIAAYLAAREQAGNEWRIRALSEAEVRCIDQYFLLSQFCDWNTQTMVNAFSRKGIEAAQEGGVFPLQAIRAIATEKNRTDTLNDTRLIGQPWFALKIIEPQRTYAFRERKPQLDHIFPKNLKDADDDYRARVDVLWNLQPQPASLNNYKRAKSPREFFLSSEGSKYYDDYDFLPKLDSDLWSDLPRFLHYRAKQMRAQITKQYGLEVDTDSR